MSEKVLPEKNKTKKRVWLILAAVISVVILAVLFFNLRVLSVKDRILTETEAQDLEDIDCVLVLGCSVRDDGSPSAMLADRLIVGNRLYQSGVSGRLLMSGDHGQDDYDEVNTMKDYAVRAGIDPEDIFCDHAGFNTYASIYRARDVFQVRRMVIVTQRYHLYRALYIAEKLGIEAYGVSADERVYRGQTVRDIREIAARCKAYIYCIFMPEPKYLGDPVPIQGSGSSTDG